MKLSIITLTYNHLKYTKKFIESLYKYTNDFELIIVDNGSTDGTVEYLKKLETELGIKLILNKDNQYIKLFSLHRNITKDKVKNLIIYNYLSAKSYILTKIKSNYVFYPKNVEIKIINGQKVGIYTDKKNIKHMVYIKCPHLKCNLVFNNVDKTWDCPCHGSRFDIDGNILFGPSVYNIKYVDKQNI